MKSRQLSNRLLLALVLVCCSQQIWAGVVKGAKGKNSTVTAKASGQTTKQPKVSHKTKTTTTTTTAKPELETTTLPADMDLDGRSAFINNQYVADPEQTIPDSTPPLYELLQQQMETVLSNTGGNIQVYPNDAPQMKEALDNGGGGAGDESQKPPGKPIFGYDMGQFDDYDEEDTNEYSSEGGEYIPDNCEDTQESLGDNDGSYVGAVQLTHANLPALQNNYGQDNSDANIFEHSTQTKPYDSSNYGTQSSNNQAASYNQNKPNESNNYNSQTNAPQNSYGSTKPSPQHNHKSVNKSGSKLKSSTQYNNQNTYNQKPSEQYQQSPSNQYVQTNQKPSSNQQSYNKPSLQQYNTAKPAQNSYNQQKPSTNNRPYTKPTTQQQTKLVYTKANQGFNSKPSYNSNYPTPVTTSINNIYNNTDALTSPYGNFNPLSTTSSYGHTNSLNPSLAPNFSYGNSNTVTSSSPFSGNNNNNKLPGNGSKRHLTFRTVSSSTQYVSTPLADLMFKFSIGMAKHGNSKLGHNALNNQAQVFSVLNDIDAKTE